MCFSFLIVFVFFLLAPSTESQMCVQESVIEDCDYANSAEAQVVWLNGEGTPLIEVSQNEMHAGLYIFAPFSQRIERTIHDRDLALDLSMHGSFELQVFVGNAEAFRSVSLHFRSGKGWYSASKNITRRGAQQLLFNRASFGSEGEPTGWSMITGIRLSAWGLSPIDSFIIINRLRGLSHKLLIILPSMRAKEKPTHLYSAWSIADRFSSMLEGIGLGVDTLDAENIVVETLKHREVVILPLNQEITEDLAGALERFVGAGGKLFVTYALAERIANLLHLRRIDWIPQERPGQFSSIQFEAPYIPGIPKEVKQSSWNITLAEATNGDMRTIGYWYDNRNRSTGYPALFAGDNGVFVSHLLLSDDWHAKQKLLAALLGYLVPEFRRRIAEIEINRMTTVGHLASRDEISSFIRNASEPNAQEELRRSRHLARKAEFRYREGHYHDAIDSARSAHAALTHAYVLSHPSFERESRAVWNHTGTGAYPGDWDRSARELMEAGFNMILPNVLRAGVAHYPSELLPTSDTFLEYGDQMLQCVRAAHKYGLEVHAWKMNWNLEGAPRQFKAELREAGRMQVSRTGDSIDWLCPSHPENVRLELGSLVELAERYSVDGIHLDYIRYPGTEGCYCDNCRQRFSRTVPQSVQFWPSDVLKPGPQKEAYLNWRVDQITRFVRLVHEQVRPVRPNLKISAAVFGDYPACVKGVGQDWLEWAEAGYVDFLCPMNYTDDDHRFCELVEKQLDLMPNSIPIYPGIGASAARSTLMPDRVVGQISLAREAGADGFTIFEYSANTAETVISAIGKGIGKTVATPIHDW